MTLAFIFALAIGAAPPPTLEYPHLPIKQAKGNSEFRVGDGWWVGITDVVLSRNGDGARLDGELTAESRTTFAGFHGTGIATVYDARGTIIYKAILPRRGVNGTWLGNSSGTRPFTIDLPPHVARRARSFTVKGYAGDGPTFLEQLKGFIKDGKNIYDQIKE